MGHRIIQQARGHGSLRYRVKKHVFVHKIQYPTNLEGEGEVVRLFNSAAHSAPLAKIKQGKVFFYIPAFKGMVEGQKINFGKTDKIQKGDILKLKDIPLKTQVYCIESRPNDGGIFVKTAGSSATAVRTIGDKVSLAMPSKKEKPFNGECRAIVGTIAGAGRLDKPIVKAGKNHHIKRAKGGRVWPRTSALKVNAVDHPFGSGRGKNPKSKIAKRNAPRGRRVGLLRPKRTGHKN
jgi:large subunit ribosomal protein L2